jgi:iron(III) transport system permease protein
LPAPSPPDAERPDGLRARLRTSLRLGRPALNAWTLIRALTFGGVLLPVLALAASLFSPASEYWGYVRDHLLPGYFAQTLILTAGAGAAAFALGVTLAWRLSLNDFWGKKFFETALVLPLAIPPYLAAYAYDGLLGFAGPVQGFFREAFGVRLAGLNHAVPAQLWATWTFTVTLYPYVYILTRAFLRHQSASIMENARLLGGGRWRMFRQVGLPLLWPAATAGTALVCLEVLNDFGVASYYGLGTFTTAIFAAWFGMGDSDTAVKLAVILLALVALILVGREAARDVRRSRIVSTRERPLIPARPSRTAQAGLAAMCAATCAAGFALPLIQMLHWLRLSGAEAFTAEIGRAAVYTLVTAGAATAAVMIAAAAVANAGRLFRSRWSTLLSQGSAMGYALPSAVLAIGVITLFVRVDGLLASLPLGLPPRALSMGGSMLVFAFFIRFFTIGHQAVEAGFGKIGLTCAEASRTMGRGVTATFFLVDLPMIRHAVVGGAALVFIDVLKELPLSLLLRPFNTETLGTAAYHFAKNEVLEQTALPSLCIIAAGAIFMILTRSLADLGKSRVSDH